MKKILALLLAVVMFASLFAGCNNTTGNTDPTDNSVAPTDNTDETPAPTEGNEEPTEGTTGDVVTLKWVTVGNGMPENYDAWKANLDKYLEEKIGVHLEMEVVAWGDWDNRRNVMVNANDGYDIMFTNLGTYQNDVRIGAFLDITDLVQSTTPTLYSTLPTELWNGVAIKDRIYAVPTWKDSSVTQYFVFDKAKAEQYIPNYSDVKELSDLTEGLTAMKDATNEAPFVLNKQGLDAIFGAKYDGLTAGLPTLGVSYTDSSAKNALEALKKLWDTTPPTPLPDPDIIPVEKVTLSQHTLELSRGSTADLSASIAPPDATDQTVLWSVSPTDIVSVDAGRVTALKKGSAVVTATSDSKSDSCTVTVTPAVYRIETAHTDSGDIPAWDTYPAKSEFFMPLTAKKAGLLLRSLEFRVKGYMPGKMRTVLRKYGTTTALADKSIDLVRGYNDVVLDMGSIALEKGVEYQLYFAAANNFYPPSVDSSWVAANDCIDIAHGSAYYGDNTTLIFSGTVVLQET